MKIVNQQKIHSSLECVFEKMYFIPSVLEKLNLSGIRYGLYAGAVIKSFAGSEELSDLDFFVHDDDAIKLKELFPFAKTRDVGDGCFLYVGHEEENLEFMFKADIFAKGHLYRHRLTDFASSSIWNIAIGNISVPFTNVIETILFKANLQREKDFKHLVLLSTLVELEPSDINYARARIVEIGCDERTKKGLISFPELQELIDSVS